MQHKRPLPKGYENVTYQDHLELRYLRWDYLIRSENPSESKLKSKERIIEYMANRIFKRNSYEFNFMGMDINDVKNIARIHTISYLSLYSVHNNEEKKKKYEKRFKNFELEIEERDNKSLMCFLEQRLIDTAFVIRQYLKGEPGFSYYSIFKRVSGDEWPSDGELVVNPSKYGWQVVPWNKFVKIRSHFQNAQPGFSKVLDGEVYRIAVPETSLINADSFFSKFNDSEDSYKFDLKDLDTPESILDSYEQKGVRIYKKNGKEQALSREDRIFNMVNKFKSKPPERKLALLKRCISMMQKISKEKGKNFSSEIAIARRLMANIKEANG